MASEFNLRIAIADYLYRIAYMLGIMNSCIGKLIVKNMHSTKTKYLKKEYYYLIEKYHKIEAAKRFQMKQSNQNLRFGYAGGKGKNSCQKLQKYAMKRSQNIHVIIPLFLSIKLIFKTMLIYQVAYWKK